MAITSFIPSVWDASLIQNFYAASKIASIDGDIRQFEKGYQTLVGEKGVTLC